VTRLTAIIRRYETRAQVRDYLASVSRDDVGFWVETWPRNAPHSSEMV
jgi:hypothetical protein